MHGARNARRTLAGIACLFFWGCMAEPPDKGIDVDPSVSDSSADGFSDCAQHKGEISFGAPLIARFDVSSHHLYDLVVLEATSVEISLGGQGEDADLDTVLRVYGPRSSSGELPAAKIAYDDDGGEGYASKITGLQLDPGTYAVVASTYGGRPADGRTYRLEAIGFADDGPAEEAEWTVLLYGAYDAGDIPSIRFPLARRLSSNWEGADRVHILLLEDLDGEPNTNIYEITGADTVLVRELGEQNTGTREALEGFIEYGAEHYPARHYALYAIGHSVSVLDGGLVDYSHGRTFIHWADFRLALEHAGVHFDVINIGTCMTATAELAYELRGVGDYLVSYQSFGQGYTAVGWADALMSSPDIGPEALARRFARAQASNGKQYMPQSVSVIDMARMARVRDALDELVPLVATGMAQDDAPFFEARMATQPGPTSTSYTGMVDLVDWVDQTAARIDGAGLEAALDGLRAAVEEAVVVSYVECDTVEENPHDRHHGMSIAFPVTNNPVGRFRTAESLYMGSPGDLALYADTQFDELLLEHF
ncbi:MAG: hypothetical protein JXR96_26025 [Deltaproteobacteria bacterium]|nr:hypothetical protein [Deltaproteobacteria bacterium]